MSSSSSFRTVDGFASVDGWEVLFDGWEVGFASIAGSSLMAGRQGRAEQSRAEQSRAGQSRTEQSRESREELVRERERDLERERS